MKKKLVMLFLVINVIASCTTVKASSKMRNLSTDTITSENNPTEISYLYDNPESSISPEELSEYLGLEAGKTYLTEDILNYICQSDFENIYEELQIFINTTDNLNVDLINQKAAELLTYASEANKKTKRLPELYDHLNSEEKKLVALYPGHAVVVYSCSKKALSESQRIYNNNVNALTNGNGDAFRHAFWNVLMTVNFSFQQTYVDVNVGANIAKLFADAHESESSGLPKEMDLYNNMVGRNIARNQFDGTWFPSESSLSNIVLSEVKNGKMKRISNGRLCATDSKMNW